MNPDSVEFEVRVRIVSLKLDGPRFYPLPLPRVFMSLPSIRPIRHLIAIDPGGNPRTDRNDGHHDWNLIPAHQSPGELPVVNRPRAVPGRLSRILLITSIEDLRFVSVEKLTWNRPNKDSAIDELRTSPHFDLQYKIAITGAFEFESPWTAHGQDRPVFDPPIRLSSLGFLWMGKHPPTIKILPVKYGFEPHRSYQNHLQLDSPSKLDRMSPFTFHNFVKRSPARGESFRRPR